jgi:hypothetical protein
MNSIRSAKPYYVAAFLFGAIIALLIVAPGRAATFVPTLELGQGTSHNATAVDHVSVVSGGLSQRL